MNSYFNNHIFENPSQRRQYQTVQTHRGSYYSQLPVAKIDLEINNYNSVRIQQNNYFNKENNNNQNYSLNSHQQMFKSTFSGYLNPSKSQKKYQITSQEFKLFKQYLNQSPEQKKMQRDNSQAIQDNYTCSKFSKVCINSRKKSLINNKILSPKKKISEIMPNIQIGKQLIKESLQSETNFAPLLKVVNIDIQKTNNIQQESERQLEDTPVKGLKYEVKTNTPNFDRDDSETFINQLLVDNNNPAVKVKIKTFGTEDSPQIVHKYDEPEPERKIERLKIEDLEVQENQQIQLDQQMENTFSTNQNYKSPQVEFLTFQSESKFLEQSNEKHKKLEPYSNFQAQKIEKLEQQNHSIEDMVCFNSVQEQSSSKKIDTQQTNNSLQQIQMIEYKEINTKVARNLEEIFETPQYSIKDSIKTVSKIQLTPQESVTTVNQIGDHSYLNDKNEYVKIILETKVQLNQLEIYESIRKVT